jgi:hypothetical protein
MYDNLELTVKKELCPENDFLHNIPQYLTTVSNNGVNQFGQYVTGYLDSLKVSISENRVKISDSSLCKYYLGDNFKTLTKGDTKRAIEKISEIYIFNLQMLQGLTLLKTSSCNLMKKFIILIWERLNITTD